METRSLIAIVLSLLVLLGFQFFYGAKQPPSGPGSDNSSTNVTTRKLEVKAADEENGQAPKTAAVPGNALAGLVSPAQYSGIKAREITVETDLYKAVFSEEGGTVKRFLLKKYRQTIDKNSPPVDLINASPPYLPLGLQLSAKPPVDLGSVIFKADKDKLDVTGSSGPAELKFVAQLAPGAFIIKTFHFKPETYWIDLSVTISGTSPIQGSIFLFNKPYQKESRYVFSGPSYYAQDKLEEIKLKKVGEEASYSGPLDWMAYGDNYFCTALIPMEASGPWGLLFRKMDDTGLVQSKLTNLSNSFEKVGEGSIEILKLGLYFGPKEIDRLKALGHNLSKEINFGWFDPIAKPLLYVLKFFYRFIHNYGWSIILLTVLIKILFWPLAHKGAQSMKTMQKLQPKLAKLKEKYKDDKERMNKELMQLYKTYKVNPMSGCLPMLLQIPVFFALYKVLLQAIELRHAPFMLWINDLSAPDRLMIPGVAIPYLGGIPVLTLLMGVSMYYQQRLRPSSMDPTQAKMMQFLPVVFTFMFINFPSGLVLYWLVNNILSIVQQVYVNKFTD